MGDINIFAPYERKSEGDMNMQKHNYLDSTPNFWRQGNHSKLIPLLFLCMLTLAASAFAVVDDVTVTIAPGTTNCDELGKTFTVNVKNESSNTHNIYEVRIYKSEIGIDLESFSCGPAPLLGWTLSDYAGGSSLPDYGYCEYKTTRTGPNVIIPGGSLDFTFKATMTISTECFSEFGVSSLDSGQPIGDHEWDNPRVQIDCVAPIVTKSVDELKILLNPNCISSGPFQGGTTEACGYWIRQGTQTHIGASDNTSDNACNLGLDYCQWRYKLDTGGWNAWNTYQGGTIPSFSFNEDSVHDIQIECYDKVGNKTIVTETDKVDDTPPVTTKYFDGPQKIGEIEWIDGVTKVVLDAVDPDLTTYSCNIGVKETKYVNKLAEELVCHSECDPDEPCLNPTVCQSLVDSYAYQIPELEWETYTNPFPKQEESCHVLFYYSEDELGNREDIQVNCFFVDKTPPGISKTYDGPYYSGDVYPDQEPSFGAEWINKDTKVKVSVTDDGTHQSGIAEVKYRVTLVEDEYCRDYEAEDQYECEDAIGDLDWTIVDQAYYDAFEFGITEESCHLIEIVAKDNVDKERVHKQCVFVDNTPPTPVKTVGEPKDKWTPGENGDPAAYAYGPNNPYGHPDITDLCWNGLGDSIDCWEVTTLTPINMGCVDEGNHPVDHETVCFNVELDGKDKTESYCHQYGQYNSDTNYCCTVNELPTFYFKEDSEHNLKYYCVDALGNTNKEVDEEKFKVDGTKFEIPLFKKWNLISVPFALLSDSPDDVFSEEKGITGVNSVWTYDPSDEICDTDWCVYTPDGVANDSLGSIAPGWGYWVMELEDEEWLTLGGSLFQTGPSGPPSRQLVEGWNLIGYYGTNWESYGWQDFDFVCGDEFRFPDRALYGGKAYCSLGSLTDLDSGPKWDSLYSYVNCGNHHYWEDYINTCADPDDMQFFNKMYAGRGYWILMDKADNSYGPSKGSCLWNDNWQCIWDGGGFI